MKMIFSFFLLFSFTVFAEGYKAPQVELSRHPHSEPTVKGESSWDEKSYKVQEKQGKDRALASEKDKSKNEDSTMLGRNPSSRKNKELNSEVMYWKWEK